MDIYGACGPLKCSKETFGNRSDCYSMLEREYKFYLSFENSICKDYVTEKLEKILHHFIVPVTLGGANYSQAAPPHSFINALDFDSPRKLAEYLNFLDKNSSEYLKYFQWKSGYTTSAYGTHIRSGLCKLCAILNGAISYKSHTDCPRLLPLLPMASWKVRAFSLCMVFTSSRLSRAVPHGTKGTGPEFVTRPVYSRS